MRAAAGLDDVPLPVQASAGVEGDIAAGDAGETAMLEDGHGEQEWQMGITYTPGASLRKVRVEELAATPCRRDVKRETRNYASHSN